MRFVWNSCVCSRAVYIGVWRGLTLSHKVAVPLTMPTGVQLLGGLKDVLQLLQTIPAYFFVGETSCLWPLTPSQKYDQIDHWSIQRCIVTICTWSQRTDSTGLAGCWLIEIKGVFCIATHSDTLYIFCIVLQFGFDQDTLYWILCAVRAAKLWQWKQCKWRSLVELMSCLLLMLKSRHRPVTTCWFEWLPQPWTAPT